jgi:hypothetical protein
VARSLKSKQMLFIEWLSAGFPVLQREKRGGQKYKSKSHAMSTQITENVFSKTHLPPVCGGGKKLQLVWS